MTQFISITDTGGNIGRIRWSNSQNTTTRRFRDANGHVIWWGTVSWDAWWPHRRPKVSKLAALMAEIADNAALAAQVLQSSVERATEAVRELNKAL